MRNSYKDFYEVVKNNGLYCSKATSRDGTIYLSGWTNPLAPEMVLRIQRFDNITYTETLSEQAQRYCNEYKGWILSIDNYPHYYQSLINDSRDTRSNNFGSLLKSNI